MDWFEKKPRQEMVRPLQGANKGSIEAAHSAAEKVLHMLEQLQSLEEWTDITKMYRQLPAEPLVVRRENPQALLNLLEKDEPISIGHAGNTSYANSVVWDPQADGVRGLDNAFLEGYGHMDGVVMVYGFSQPDGFRLERHPESQQVFAGVDRLRVRSATGIVPREAVKFVTIRVPITAFPEERMTEEEKDVLWDVQNGAYTEPKFIHRGFLAKEKAADLAMAA